MSELYFDYLPNELNIEILNYVDDYDTFINLYELKNFTKIFNTKVFWKSLFRNSIGNLIEYININFKIINIHYMALSYIKAVTSYEECRDVLNQLKDLINLRIQEYYPERTMETIDVDLMENEGIYDILSNKGIYISIMYHNFQDLSFFFKNYVTDVDLDPILGEYFLKNNTFNIKMNIDFLGYYITIYDTDRNINVDTAPLKEKEFLGIMFNLKYSGEVMHDFYDSQ